MDFLLDDDRVEAIAQSLGRLGYDAFIELDREEPEYRVLSKIYSIYRDERVVLVLGVAAALIDYQLNGDAYVFWNTLDKIVNKYIGAGRLDLGDVEDIMFEFVEEDVCARYRDQKRRRLDRFFKRYGPRLWSSDYRFFSNNPVKIWYSLAEAMDQELFKKTIVFAMKILDLVSMITRGEYADFRDIKYIPTDYHVIRMSLYSGVIKPRRETIDIDRLVKSIRQTSDVEHIISRAWYSVTVKASEIMGKNISTLRIDSLLWQLSKKIRRDMSKREAINTLTKYLVEKARVEPDTAYSVVSELLYCYPL